jgi:hypothetical protein
MGFYRMNVGAELIHLGGGAKMNNLTKVDSIMKKKIPNLVE